MVGLLQQPDARRGGADRELGDDRRPRARRRAGARSRSRSSTRCRFPPQEHKIGGRRRRSCDRAQVRRRVDDELGLVTFRRGVASEDEPLPKAFIPASPLHTGVQRDAVLRFAKDPERYPALVEILERRRPERYVFVQGPPGSGKTYTGARRAVDLMKAGQRVGVTALSHKAINQFLKEVESVGYEFRGRKKSSGEDTEFEGRCIDSSDGQRRSARPRAAADRGHVVPLLTARVRPACRHAVRGRGRADGARRRARGRDGGAEADPARRPEPAAAGFAGLASAGRGRVGARAPARRGRDRAARRWGSSSSRRGGCGRR